MHYVAVESEGRILVPDVQVLRSLRHRWCWERRSRPHIPTWSFAKVPREMFSPNENARMLCVYMRPWTLNPEESTSTNPLLSLLGKCIVTSVADIPVWTRLRTSGTGPDDAGLMQGMGAALGVDARP